MKKFLISFGVVMLLTPLAAMAVPHVHEPVNMKDRVHHMDESYVFDDPGFGTSTELYGM